MLEHNKVASIPEAFWSTHYVQRSIQGSKRTVKSNKKWKLEKVTVFIFKVPTLMQIKPLKQTKMKSLSS
jgi:hypothetical protein